MGTHRLSGLLLASAALALSAFSSAIDTTVVAVYRMRRALNVVASFFGAAFDKLVMAVFHKSAPNKPAVLLMQAKQFVLRTIKRERPQIEARYRMCPST